MGAAMSFQCNSRMPARRKLKIGSLIFISVLLASCLNTMLEKPDIALRSISVSPRSFTDMNLIIGMDVSNSNRLDLTLHSFDFVLILNDRPIGDGRLERELVIPANSTSRVQASINAKFKDVGHIVKTVITGKDMAYKIEGRAGLKTALGTVSYPFAKEGRIDLTQK